MYLRLKNKTNYTQLSNSSTLNGCKTATESLFPVSHGLKKQTCLITEKLLLSLCRQESGCFVSFLSILLQFAWRSPQTETTQLLLVLNTDHVYVNHRFSTLHRYYLWEGGLKLNWQKKRHLKQLSLNFNAWYSLRLEMHWAYALKKNAI